MKHQAYSLYYLLQGNADSTVLRGPEKLPETLFLMLSN
jgi:hypothetical protein